MEVATGFTVGLAIGIAGYKFFIFYLIGKPIHTACDYCRFMIKKEELFSKKNTIF